jgi:hypothetical protein
VQGDFDIERPGSEDSDVEFRMGKDEKSKNNSYRQLVVFSVLVSGYLDVGFIFHSLFDVRRSMFDVPSVQCRSLLALVYLDVHLY